MINWVQRVQYAKTKSDCVAKADGTFVPREKKKKQEEKGDPKLFCTFLYHSSSMYIKYNIYYPNASFEITYVSFSFLNYC